MSIHITLKLERNQEWIYVEWAGTSFQARTLREALAYFATDFLNTHPEFIEQRVYPSFYTLEEGGQWIPWNSKPTSILVSELDSIPVVSGNRRIFIGGKNVHSIAFGVPNIDIDDQPPIWDCVNGWRYGKRP